VRSEIILLVALSLGFAGLAGAAGPPAESPRVVIPATPGSEHPAERSGRGQLAGPSVVDLTQLVPRSLAELPNPNPRSHIQGQPPAEAAVGEWLPTPALRRPSSPAQPPPTAESDPRLTASGDLVRSFDGLAASGWIPPDTVLAVGPNHVIEAVNSGFAIYTKDGDLERGYFDLETFFGPALPVGWNGFLFDPRVHYSVEFDRYFLLALGLDAVGQDSFVFIAVSQGSFPTSSWWLYRWSDPFNSDAWIDYAGFSVDSFGAYFTGNEFYWAGGFKHSILQSMDLGMLSGGAVNAWIFWGLTWNSGAQAFGLQPAIAHSIAGDQATFFVNTFSGSGTTAALWKLTGNRGNAPTLVRNTITVGPYDAAGETVEQPGTTADLDGGDSRVLNAAYSQRRVFFTLTDDVFANGSESGFYLGKLNVDSLVAEGSTTYWSTGFYYFYPALTLAGGADPNADLGVVVSYSTPSTAFVSTAFKVLENFPTDTTGAFPQTAAGLASYEARDNLGRNRWGDYSGVGWDWTCGTFWAAAEYAGPANSWRTRISQHLGPAGDACRLIFDDGFESGNFFHWQ
jgi:hypothetical protein